jgi:hypothetical protein
MCKETGFYLQREEDLLTVRFTKEIDMKKLLALVLVLGMASLAAANFQLSVNGQPAPDEITLEPSDWIEIDMDWVEGYQVNFDIALVLSNDLASFKLPYWVQDNPLVGHWENFRGVANYTLLAIAPFQTIEPQQIRIGASMAAGAFVQGPAKIFDGVMLHCDGEGDVILDLVVVDPAGTTSYAPDFSIINYDNGQVLDRLVIHQIPEPMTMALLGIGGLALIRRRR